MIYTKTSPYINNPEFNQMMQIPFHQMTKDQFIIFLDAHAWEQNNRICTNIWNKDETYEYCISRNIQVGENRYRWYDDTHKIKGRSMASTKPYIIVNDTTNAKPPPTFTGLTSGIIKLSQFTMKDAASFGKADANRIIQAIRTDLVTKALKQGLPVPYDILKELEIEHNTTNIALFQVNRRTSVMHKETLNEQIPVNQFANVKEARKYAQFRANKLSQSGYQGEITYQTEDQTWHILKRFKAKQQ